MSDKRLSQRALREMGIAEDQIAAEGNKAAMTPDPRPLTAKDDGVEASLAYIALGEAIRTAAFLRTENVTIEAPLARYLRSTMVSLDAEREQGREDREAYQAALHDMDTRYAALVEAAQAAVLVGDGLRGWWRDGEDVATVPLVSLGAVQAAIARLRAALPDGWQERGNPGDESDG